MAVAVWIKFGQFKLNLTVGGYIQKCTACVAGIGVQSTVVLIQYLNGIFDLFVGDIIRCVVIDDVDDDWDGEYCTFCFLIRVEVNSAYKLSPIRLIIRILALDFFL